MSYNQAEDALRTILKEMISIKNGNISDEEFNRAKQQIKENTYWALKVLPAVCHP